MADFLTRLVGRTLGLMPTVQPIISSRFGATSIRASDDYYLGFEEIHNDFSQPAEEREAHRSDRSGLPNSPTVSRSSPMPLFSVGEGSLSLKHSLNSQSTDAQTSNQREVVSGLPNPLPQPPEERGEQESDRSELPSPPAASHPRSIPFSSVGEDSLSLGQSLNSQAVSFEDMSQEQPVIKSNTFRIEQSVYQTNTNLSSLEQPDILESDTTLASSRIIPTQVPNQKQVEVLQTLRGDVPAQQAEAQRKQHRSAGIQPVGEQEDFDVLQPVISIPNPDLTSSPDRTLPQFTDTSNHQSIPKLPNPPTTPSSSTPPMPTIRVSIGRVEVRAIMPPASPTCRPTPVRSSPTLSLNDYLKQRRRGH